MVRWLSSEMLPPCHTQKGQLVGRGKTMQHLQIHFPFLSLTSSIRKKVALT